MRTYAADVTSDDTATQAEGGVVGAGNDLLLRLELDDGHDRAEDLLAGNGHLVMHLAEDGRLDPVSLGGSVVARHKSTTYLVAMAGAAVEQLGALALALLDVADDTVELDLVDNGALVASGVCEVTRKVLTRKRWKDNSGTEIRRRSRTAHTGRVQQLALPRGLDALGCV